MSAIFPAPLTPSYRLADNNTLNTLLANPNYSSEDSITAHSGGGQTSAYLLTATISRITTAAANDSVRLPGSKAGSMVIVINDSSNAVQVFGKETATINDIATGTGVSVAPGTSVVYFCPIAGKWYTIGIPSQSIVGGVQASYGTSATTVTSSTTLVNVTGLTATLIAGGVYEFYVHIPCTSDSAGGTKAAMGGTSTWTSINTTVQNNTAAAIAITTGTTATPGTSIAGSTATNIQVIAQGVVVCNAGGTLTAMFAQNVSDATSSVALANSFMLVTRIA